MTTLPSWFACLLHGSRIDNLPTAFFFLKKKLSASSVFKDVRSWILKFRQEIQSFAPLFQVVVNKLDCNLEDGFLLFCNISSIYVILLDIQFWNLNFASSLIYSRYPIVEINQSYPCFRPIRSLFLSPVEMLSYRTKGTATLFRNSPPQADRFDRSDFKDSNETSFLPNFQTQIVKSFHWLGRQNRNPIIIRATTWIPSLRSRHLHRDIDDKPIKIHRI